jgi:hypothetical protein
VSEVNENEDPGRGEPREPHPPRARGKRVRRRALWLAKRVGLAVGVVLLLLGAFLAYLHTSSGQELLRARVEARLRERVTTSVTLGGLRFSLFSGIVLEDLVVLDRDGQRAVVIARAHVDPSLLEIARGTLAFEELAIEGVTVDIRGRDDGTTNLTGVVRAAEPPPEGAPPAEPRERIVVRKLSVRGVGLRLSKPDGLRVAVDGLSLEGKADARPREKGLEADLALAVARLSVERPTGAVTLTELTTRASASFASGGGGAGRAKVGPTAALVEVTREGAEPARTRVAIPEAVVDLTPERLEVALEALEIAALSAGAVRVVATRTPEGAIDHVPDASVTRLLIQAKDVEALAGRRVLASDITVDVTAKGPKEALVADVRVKTGGGDLALRATLDLRDRSALGYDASLETTGLDLTKIVVSEKVPPVTTGTLTVAVKGRGTTPAEARALATLAVRDVKVRDVTVDSLDARARLEDGLLTIESFELRALGQGASASGTYRLTDKAIDLELTLDARIRELLTRLRAAGVKTPTSPLVASLALGRPAKIHAEGRLDSELTVQVREVDVRALGGSARGTVTARLVRGDPDKDEKAFVARHVDADLELRGVSLAEIGRLRGKPLPVTGRASGRVHVRGDAAAPEGDVDLTVALDDPASPGERAGTLRVTGTATAHRIDGHARVTTASGEELVRIEARGTRAGRGLAGPLRVTMDVEERPLSDFAPLLRPEIREKLPADARVAVRGLVESRGRTTHVEVDLDARLREGAAPITLRARADARGPATALGTAPLAWTLDLEVPETDLASLPLPPDRRERLEGLRGTAALAVHARGTRADVTGEAELALRGIEKGALGPAEVRVSAAIRDSETAVDVDARVSEVPVLEGGLRAMLGGKGLLTAARTGALRRADPALEGELRIPDAPLASWARILPAAEGLPGHAGGSLKVQGRARDPELALRLDYAGYPTLEGRDGALALEAKGTRERATAVLRVNDAVELSASASPREILEARANGGEAKVEARLSGEAVPLASLLPASDRMRALRPEGAFDANLEADATVAFRDDSRELSALSLRGPLTVTGGALVIPGTSRRLHHVEVRVAGDGDRLAIRRIEARESDRDEPNRSLFVEGAYAVRERQLSLHAKTHRVLVSGGNFGQLDAPRAALTADLGVRADLSGRVRRVEVNVASLELVSPDRQPRAAQQEVLSLGDVIEVGPGVTVGKLPVPNRSSADDAAVAGEVAPPPRAEDKTLDVVVRIPNVIRVEQRPLELFAKGEIHIERFGERRVMSGKLIGEDGSLLIGGRSHRLAKGEVRMTDDGAFLDLHFRREPHVAALRDIATADGTDVYAHMVGLMGQQKISFSGAADGLFEAIAIENMGRVRVVSRPDMPAAQTAQLPQTPQLRMTAFMSANLPHLAFLDRMSTYADPNAGRFAYGRFENLEAERYSKDGRRRFRTTVRPRTIGQSDSEVEGDLLFVNTKQVVSGVGVLGGTRVGGGPVIFWEWSSAD